MDLETVEEYIHPNITKDDILSGRIAFRVLNPEGQSYLFLSDIADDKRVPGDKIIFIRYCSGETEKNKGRVRWKFDYLARMKPLSSQLFHSVNQSCCTTDDLPWKVASWVFKILWGEHKIPLGYQIERASEEPDALR
jgi:hypothetical protein